MTISPAKQLSAAKRIAALAADASNEQIETDIDSLFAGITSACYEIENQIEKADLAKRGTAAGVNARLRKMGVAERLVKGEGYCYFTEGEAMDWPSASVMVYRISDMTVGEWIEEYKRLKAAHEADKR